MERKDVNVLHHLGLISRNMASTIGAYERLGFVFAPLTLPRIPVSQGGAPQPIGVGNRCAIFENNYLEVLAVVEPQLWGSISSEQRGPFNIDLPLQRYEGLHVLHLGTDDLESVRTRLIANGLTPTSIRPFQRVKTVPEQCERKACRFHMEATRKHFCRLPNMKRRNWFCSRVTCIIRTERGR